MDHPTPASLPLLFAWWCGLVSFVIGPFQSSSIQPENDIPNPWTTLRRVVWLKSWPWRQPEHTPVRECLKRLTWWFSNSLAHQSSCLAAGGSWMTGWTLMEMDVRFTAVSDHSPQCSSWQHKDHQPRKDQCPFSFPAWLLIAKLLLMQ